MAFLNFTPSVKRNMLVPYLAQCNLFSGLRFHRSALCDVDCTFNHSQFYSSIHQGFQSQACAKWGQSNSILIGNNDISPILQNSKPFIVSPIINRLLLFQQQLFFKYSQLNKHFLNCKSTTPMSECVSK